MLVAFCFSLSLTIDGRGRPIVGDRCSLSSTIMVGFKLFNFQDLVYFNCVLHEARFVQDDVIYSCVTSKTEFTFDVTY